MRNTSPRFGALLATIGLSASAVGVAQTAPPATPVAVQQFEVASVKRSTSTQPGASLSPQGRDRLVVTNAPPRFIIQVAYGVPEYRLEGGPEWIGSERYDIQAKADRDVPFAQMLPMLRALLVERFKLATHSQTRSMPGYALVLARQDGTPGERLRPADPGCVPSQRPAAPRAFGSRDMPPCGMAITSDRSIRMNGRTLAELATALSQRVGRPVTDRTGLAGRHVIQLDWVPDPRPGAPIDPSAAAAPDDGVVLFTALQEQLGLKLESERVDVEVVVIDHVERPTPD